MLPFYLPPVNKEKYFEVSFDTKIKIAPSVDKGRILIRILVTCLHLKRTKNDKREQLRVDSVVLGHTLTKRH